MVDVGNQTSYAVLHKGQYDVGVFLRDGASDTSGWRSIPTTPFGNTGGENIGALFQHEGQLYMSCRYNLLYTPLSMPQAPQPTPDLDY